LDLEKIAHCKKVFVVVGQRNSAKTRDECNLDKNGSDVQYLH
jgi:hypothetical protein